MNKRFGTIASIIGLIAVMALMIVSGLQVSGLSTMQRNGSAVSAFAGGMNARPSGHKQPTKPAPGKTQPATSAGMPYTQGVQVMDGSGQPLLLRGAQIESPFNYIVGWQIGTPVSKYLNPAVFQAMTQQWHMNVLRLPISNWIYNSNPSRYLSLLDQVVQEANSAGLYVVLDLHDDAKSGSPYGDNARFPKQQDLVFWQAIASHYKNNPMVMFDPFNEPQTVGWQYWLHGGNIIDGVKVVGFQDLVNAIRGAGAQQIIVVEPGNAGGNAPGWKTAGNNLIAGSNIMYSLHEYQGIVDSPQQEDAKWGPVLNHYPIYYGEWGLITNGSGKSSLDHCQNINHAQADQIVANFLNYMASRHANWSAWEFEPYELIQSETTFAPTTLDMPWTCGDSSGHAGMGTLIQQFLTTGKA